MGASRFVGSKTLEVRLNDGVTRVLAGERVFINLGAPCHDSTDPRPDRCIIAHEHRTARAERTQGKAKEALDRLPEHLVVLGGGYVGLEFAQDSAASGAA